MVFVASGQKGFFHQAKWAFLIKNKGPSSHVILLFLSKEGSSASDHSVWFKLPKQVMTDAFTSSNDY